jgi:polyisoprenoid-binding protein YceI
MRKCRSLNLLLLGLLAAGCASTHVEDRRQAGPQPAARPGSTTIPADQQSGAITRVVPLSAENTRVTFVGSAGPTSHEGGFDRLSGEWNFPTEDPKDSRLVVRIDTDSVRTKIGLMTTHLKREDFFDVKHFPTASFASNRFEPQPGPDGKTHFVTGELTIHGVTRPVAFRAKVGVTADAVSLDGMFTISQTAFGMATAAEKTRDEVPVTVSVNASRR